MGRRRRNKGIPTDDEVAPEWVPKTEIGRRVHSGDVISIEEIFETGKPILEPQIVDKLLPNLSNELIEVCVTQRMTDCGRKAQFKAIVAVGDGRGHLGLGVGKSEETGPAAKMAFRNAKKNIISVPLGCGSWECGCGTTHSVPIKTNGKNGSVSITIRPAPRGVGIVANETVRRILSLAGVKDAWCNSRGRTRGIYNTSMAVYHALDNLNRMKIRGQWSSQDPQPEMQPPQAAQAAQKPGHEAMPAADAATQTADAATQTTGA
ncbi:MAG: 30S ribosomal protein S5 [Candidatus Micrarchaeota archaeon]|nr:30S ribosomal protein S5 [Candidatus Micrarchaeota archaeon]